MKSLQLSISGKVQGVFFRHSAQQEAEKLGLNGFARNESNGSVHIEIEGDEAALDAFIAWARAGSSAAQVEHVEATTQPLQNFADFQIL